MKLSDKVLREKILEVFTDMQEAFRRVKPAISLIDSLAITNQGHSNILALLGEREKELREKVAEIESFNDYCGDWVVKELKEILGGQTRGLEA